MWSTESGMKVAVLDGKHSGPINTLQFNPRYMTFASACTDMVRSCHMQMLRLGLLYLKYTNEQVIQFFLCYFVFIFRRFGCRVLMTYRPAVLGCGPIILHLECKRHIWMCCWLTVKNFSVQLTSSFANCFQPFFFYIMFLCTENENIFCKVFGRFHYLKTNDLMYF